MIAAAISVGLAGCEIIDDPAALEGGASEDPFSDDETRASIGTPDSVGDTVDIDFLLGMSYPEAVAMSSMSMEVPPFFRVAAHSIEHPPVLAGEKVTGFEAKGNVFLEIDLAESLTALCDHAEVSESEVILRGRPVLRRGSSVVEATSQDTFFIVNGIDDIQVEGPHRLRQLGDRIPAGDLGNNPLLPPLDGTDMTAPADPGAIGDGSGNSPIDPADLPEGVTVEQIEELMRAE